MRHQRQPTQLSIMFILLLLAVTGAVEIIIYVIQNMLARCGPFCGVLMAEPVIGWFAR